MSNLANRIRIVNGRDLRDVARDLLAKKKALRRPPAMIYPHTAERDYVRALLPLVQDMKGQVNSVLVPALPALLELASRSRPTIDGFRSDEYDYATEVEKLMSLIKSGYEGIYSEVQIADFVRRIGLAVSAQNGKELGKVFRAVIGVDVFTSEPWLQTEMQAFVSQNVSLIKTIPEKYFAAIEQRVFDAARRGISYRELQGYFQKEFGKSRSSAERIARDQIGSFNGHLSQLRQTQAGLRRYTWRTSRDERVRDEHRNREGQVFSWDKPPHDGHPGQPIMCRCWAEPDIEDVLNFE